MQPGIAIINKMTGSPDFAGCEVVTISPDPRQPVLVECLKCPACGHSMSLYQCHKDHPPMTFDEKFALVD